MTLTNSPPSAPESRGVDVKVAAAEAIIAAAESINERYDGYRYRLTQAVVEIIGTQRNLPTKTARNREIDKIIKVEGRQLITETRT